MVKVKVQHLYGTPEQVKAWKEEADWIGRNVSRIDPENPGHLIVYPIPPKKKSRPKPEDEGKTPKRERGPRKGNGFNRYKEIE